MVFPLHDCQVSGGARPSDHVGGGNERVRDGFEMHAARPLDEVAAGGRFCELDVAARRRPLEVGRHMGMVMVMGRRVDELCEMAVRARPLELVLWDVFQGLRWLRECQ